MKECHFKTLRILSGNPAVSQREIAKELRLSLGKVNYVLNALISKGYVKMKRFKNSGNKFSYMYMLTPEGIRKKAELTYKFLRMKSEEYETLNMEIEKLKEEVQRMEAVDFRENIL